jgi:hypothetical protein
MGRNQRSALRTFLVCFTFPISVTITNQRYMETNERSAWPIKVGNTWRNFLSCLTTSQRNKLWRDYTLIYQIIRCLFVRTAVPLYKIRFRQVAPLLSNFSHHAAPAVGSQAPAVRPTNRAAPSHAADKNNSDVEVSRTICHCREDLTNFDFVQLEFFFPW